MEKFEEFVTKEAFENYQQLVKDNHIVLKNVDDYQKEQIKYLNEKIEEINKIITQFLIR